MSSQSGKALVTGGAGFIGSNLVERLLADGTDVRVLDNFATGSRENLAAIEGDVDVVEGDIQSYERVSTAVRGCEVVYHQAALPSVPRSIQDPLTSNSANVIGTLNVLLAARDAGVRRVVFASSSSVYGSNAQLPKQEDMATAHLSPYAVAKLAAENYCRCFYEVYGLETVAIRYLNGFGPRQDPNSQYSAVIPKFITAILEGQKPTIFGDGEQSRDFTYIDNTVEANVLAASAEGAAGQVMNVACGERISLNELLTSLARISGTEVEADYLPARPGDVPHSMADVEKAREVIGFEPGVGVDEGLAKTFAYYSERAEAPQAL
ncbi:MAG: SDR family oxidoreductase [Solirubrobacterales bacterium]